jgi:osmotically-inducible protein OsmY
MKSCTHILDSCGRGWLIAALACLLTAGCATSYQKGGVDAEIEGNLLERLYADDVVRLSRIGVIVVGGEATLSGHVNGPMGRARALSIAEGTSGVSSVIDNMEE